MLKHVRGIPLLEARTHCCSVMNGVGNVYTVFVNRLCVSDGDEQYHFLSVLLFRIKHHSEESQPRSQRMMILQSSVIVADAHLLTVASGFVGYCLWPSAGTGQKRTFTLGGGRTSHWLHSCPALQIYPGPFHLLQRCTNI